MTYPGIFPVGSQRSWGPPFVIRDETEKTIKFSGNGIVVKGNIEGELSEDYVGEVEFNLDGKLDTVMKLPMATNKRALELYWNLNLPKGNHMLSLGLMSQRVELSLLPALSPSRIH